jgi:hypothetical protein
MQQVQQYGPLLGIQALPQSVVFGGHRALVPEAVADLEPGVLDRAGHAVHRP